jgi:serine/threonine protein kinase
MITKLGKYDVKGEIASGGMGVVYLAESVAGEQFAIKQVLEQQWNDEARQRFDKEVEACKQIHSPRVASYVDAGVEGDRPWLATKYIPGDTLREYVTKKGPLPLEMAAIFGASLAEGLEHVHREEIIHRDVKPQNVILAQDGPVLIDFGLANLKQAKHDVDLQLSITAPRTILGTVTCMPPEQVWGTELTDKADVYALGATLLFAATGHYPYDGDSASALTRKIEAREIAPDLSDLPSELLGIVTEMLAYEPDDRPTAEAAAAKLVEVVGTKDGGASEARIRLRSMTASDTPTRFRHVDTDLLDSVDLVPAKSIQRSRVTATPDVVVDIARDLCADYARSAKL